MTTIKSPHQEGDCLTATWRVITVAALAGLISGVAPARLIAQEPGRVPVPVPVPLVSVPVPVPEESRKVAVAKFFAGAAVGFGLHEAGHLAAGWERYDVSRRRAIVTASAGFWTQYLTSEKVLTSHPNLRSEESPFRKGVLAFHLGASAGYTVLALTRTGPWGRDTHDMSRALGVSERWIGAIVITPMVLDGIRYLHPDARWAKWLSRGAKIGSVALVLR